MSLSSSYFSRCTPSRVTLQEAKEVTALKEALVGVQGQERAVSLKLDEVRARGREGGEACEEEK